MASDKVNMTVTIDRDLLDEIDDTCATLHMNRSAFVSGLLAAGLGTGNPMGFLRDAYRSAKKGKKTKETTITGDDSLVVI